MSGDTGQILTPIFPNGKYHTILQVKTSFVTAVFDSVTQDTAEKGGVDKKYENHGSLMSCARHSNGLHVPSQRPTVRTPIFYLNGNLGTYYQQGGFALCLSV